MLRQSVGVLLCILTLVSANTLAAERIALVIGNGDYEHVTKLRNPPKDVRLIKESLNDIGFNVTMLVDADFGEMKTAVRKFRKELNDSGKNTIGLFYFAGHGVTYDEKNFLIPVTAEIEAGPDLPESTVSAQWILGMMETAGNATSVMILDACRDNPYRGILTSGTRSLAQGMAKMDAPDGSFVAFSTADGQLAYDGEGDYSPFAQAFAIEVKAPDVSIGDMMTRVNSRVRKATKGLGKRPQIPWTENSLADILMFNPRANDKKQGSDNVEPVPTPQQVVQPRKKSREELEEQMWGVVEDSEDPAQYEAFLEDFPDGRYAKYAKLKKAQYSKKPDQQAAAEPAATQASAIQPTATQPQGAQRGAEPDVAALCRQFAAGDSSEFADCMDEMAGADEDDWYPPDDWQAGTSPQGGNYPQDMPNQQMSTTATWYDDEYTQWQVIITGDNFTASALVPGSGAYQLQGRSQGYGLNYGIFDAAGQQIGYGQGTIVDASHIAVTSYWANGTLLGSTRFHVNHAPQ